MTAAPRTPVYIELNDDITTAIEKINQANGDQLSVVIPKRSTLFQSAVNLKLLRKAALDVDKNLALVSKDKAINGIAAHLKMPVAADLEQAPEIPPLPTPEADLPSDVIDDEVAPEAVTAAVANPPKGKLKTFSKSLHDPGKRKLKIPDFDRFKKRLFLIILGLILLAGGLYAAFELAPKATVLIKGRTRTVGTEFKLLIDPAVKEVNLETMASPAVVKEVSKTLSKSTPTTGQKDIGKKSTGTISVKNCEDSDPRTLPANTVFTASGKNFLSNSAITVPGGTFSGGGSVCTSSAASVTVTAEKSGDIYNLGPTTYSTGSLSGNFQINGGQMSGGTTEVAKVVSTADIEKTKTELLEAERAKTKTELSAQFNGDEEVVILESFTEGVAEATSAPAVDEKADTATVTIKVNYFVLGVKKDDLKKLLAHKQSQDLSQEEADKLKVIEEGVDSAQFRKQATESSGSKQVFLVSTTGVIGPNIDIDKLKSEIAGGKYNDTLEYIKGLPNVLEVEIRLSPFWVFKIPEDPEDISIEFEIQEQ